MRTILYAEDDREQLRMMRMVLEGKNFQLIEARDGKEAIDKIKAFLPDLILLDLFMPRIDGFSVLRHIKADPQTAPIPVIVLSAWPTGDNRKRAHNTGAVDFVAKPYVPTQLVKIIRKHLAIPETSDLAL